MSQKNKPQSVIILFLLGCVGVFAAALGIAMVLDSLTWETVGGLLIAIVGIILIFPIAIIIRDWLRS